jgi:hypothetical protein
LGANRAKNTPKRFNNLANHCKPESDTQPGTATGILLDDERFLAAKLAWQEGVLRDPELTDAAKLVGCQLMHDFHSEKHFAWRSIEQFAELFGKHRRTIQRSIGQLANRGHIEIKTSPGRGYGNEYRALMRPVDGEGAPKKAAPVSHLSLGRAAPGLHTFRQKAAPGSQNGGAGAAPYLEKTINSPLPPSRVNGVLGPSGERAASDKLREPHSPVGAGSTQGSSGRRLTAVPDNRRAPVAADLALGEGWARSYLDHCSYDPDTNTIHPRTGTAATELRKQIGGLLRSLGLVLGDVIGTGP